MSDAAPVTMFGPDFPFAFDDWIAHPAGLGSIPAERHGAKVAIIGAGISGVLCGYELMRMGVHPVLYESGQLGGRLRSQPFEGADGVIAELGGMRFPVSSTGFYHYVDKLGLESRPFPNPLTPAAGSTVIDLWGETHYAETLDDLPPLFREVATAYEPGARGRGEVLRPQGGDPRPRPGTDQGDLGPDRARLGRADVLRLRGVVSRSFTKVLRPAAALVHWPRNRSDQIQSRGSRRSLYLMPRSDR